MLKEICKRFDVDINEILDGKKPKKRKGLIWYYAIGAILIIALIILIAISLLRNNDNDFHFKVLSSGCENFTISGSAAYNNNQSHIFISEINYCGGDDDTKFVKIECSLYQTNGDVNTRLYSHIKESEEGITLEEFLQDVVFRLEDVMATCSTFNNSEMFLRIDATDKNNKTITHRIPLVSELTCPNS